jgi:hippurate hydrolase
VLDGDQPGPTVLLRGDMDALPMPEDTGLEYASQNKGVMHACGHDAHTAMLASAARLLCDRRGELAGRVVFMTGDTLSPGSHRFLKEAGRPVLPKPVAMDQLNRMVGTVLQSQAGEVAGVTSR